jgi:hypothetical protein
MLSQTAFWQMWFFYYIYFPLHFDWFIELSIRSVKIYRDLILCRMFPSILSRTRELTFLNPICFGQFLFQILVQSDPFDHLTKTITHESPSLWRYRLELCVEVASDLSRFALCLLCVSIEFDLSIHLELEIRCFSSCHQPQSGHSVTSQSDDYSDDTCFTLVRNPRYSCHRLTGHFIWT